MPAGDSFVAWIVAALGTGGVGKFAYDLITARTGGRKAKAEGSVMLVNSAAQYAEGLVKRIDRMDAEFEEYRREQDARNRAQERLFREHSSWDAVVQRKLADLGEQVPPAPPLYVD